MLPAHETISYSIEWRLIYAGNAQLSLDPKLSGGKQDWQSKLHLESGGMVSKLYKLEDNYTVQMENQFCATSSDFNSMERSRHHETTVNYDPARHKASYLERDLLKNSTFKTAETEIPACVSDMIGGLYKLRSLKLEPGQTTQISSATGRRRFPPAWRHSSGSSSKPRAESSAPSAMKFLFSMAYYTPARRSCLSGYRTTFAGCRSRFGPGWVFQLGPSRSQSKRNSTPDRKTVRWK